jgi:hypothetical protein
MQYLENCINTKPVAQTETIQGFKYQSSLDLSSYLCLQETTFIIVYALAAWEKLYLVEQNEMDRKNTVPSPQRVLYEDYLIRSREDACVVLSGAARWLSV